MSCAAVHVSADVIHQRRCREWSIVGFLLLSYIQKLKSTALLRASCQTLIDGNNADGISSLVCGGAVDYLFYVPAGSRANDFNDIATARLSNVPLSFLGENCLVAYKKFVCSAIYLPCLVSQNATSSRLLGDNSEESHVMPFYRPCVSLCHDVANICGSFSSVIDDQLDCRARFNYSYGQSRIGKSFDSPPFQFYQREGDSICNAMDGSFSIGSRVESYIYESNGFCRGIASNVYIPPNWESFWAPRGILRGSYFSPMQPSYVVQETIEQTLTLSISAVLPVWLSTKCQMSLRKYFCGKYLAEPEKLLINRESNLAVHLVENEAVGPFEISVPHYDPALCVNYERDCGDFSAYPELSILAPTCDLKYQGNEVSELKSISSSHSIDSNLLTAVKTPGKIIPAGEISIPNTSNDYNSSSSW